MTQERRYIGKKNIINVSGLCNYFVALLAYFIARMKYQMKHFTVYINFKFISASFNQLIY